MQKNSRSDSKKSKKKSNMHVHFDQQTIEKSEIDEIKRPLKKHKNDKPQDDTEYVEAQVPKSRTKSLFEEPKKKWLDNLTINDKTYKTGKFTSEELNLLMKSTCEYVSNNNLGKEGLIKLITQKASNETFGAWSKISSCLPNRTVQSCHNVCRRKFNPNNYKGRWAKEEEARLLELVDEIGRKWKVIAEELGRTAENVKDKYKSLGEENHQDRVKDSWSLKELIKLLKYVQRRVGKVFLKEDIDELVEEEKIMDELYDDDSSKLNKKRRRKDVLDDQLVGELKEEGKNSYHDF